MRCPNCNAELQVGDQFCSNCGIGIRWEMPRGGFCPNCGKEAMPGAAFCMSCGYKLDGTAEEEKGFFKKNVNLVVAGIMVLLIAVVAMSFSGRSIEKQLVGIWYDVEGDEIGDSVWAFDENGNVTVNVGRNSLSGTYSVSNERKLMMNLSYLWANMPVTADIKMAGDKMFFTNVEINLKKSDDFTLKKRR